MKFKVFLFVLAFLMVVMSGNAGVLQPGQIVTVQYIGNSGATASGIYVGPYELRINNLFSILAVCNDPYQADQISAGNQWQAVVSYYSDLSRTRFGSRVNAQQLYGEIGVLDQDMFARGPSSFADDHTALLNMVDPSFAMTSGAPARQQWAAGQLANANLGLNFWLTPVNSRGVTLVSGFQEFGSAVPEPSTCALFGGGLLLGAGLFRRWRRQS
jgi:hypothetical protein